MTKVLVDMGIQLFLKATWPLPPLQGGGHSTFTETKLWCFPKSYVILHTLIAPLVELART